MKNIKYRAWAIINECYLNIDSGYFYLAPDGTFFEITELRNGETDYREVSADVQLCTGLKDCNAVEIYEKDIVEFEGGVFLVSHDDENACYALTTRRRGELKIDRNLNGHAASVCKIIGNIYENPELLEK